MKFHWINHREVFWNSTLRNLGSVIENKWIYQIKNWWNVEISSRLFNEILYMMAYWYKPVEWTESDKEKQGLLFFKPLFEKNYKPVGRSKCCTLIIVWNTWQ